MSKNLQYELFVEKFKPKLTTDDCYTPAPVYNAVLEWAKGRFPSLEGKNIVRPFYPGGDFESYEYQPEDVVLDNPPFSIMSKIVRFYTERRIPFFLFAPSLTITYCAKFCTCVICNVQVTYANGAIVNTSFVTNLYAEDYAMLTEPTLRKAVSEANAIVRAAKRRSLAKIRYPDNVTSAALLSKVANVDYCIPRGSCVAVRKLDGGQSIFGGGLLLSDDIAAELRAAELRAAELRAAELRAAELRAAELRAAELRAKDEVRSFSLSRREQDIVAALGGK